MDNNVINNTEGGNNKVEDNDVNGEEDLNNVMGTPLNPSGVLPWHTSEHLVTWLGQKTDIVTCATNLCILFCMKLFLLCLLT